MVWGRKGKEEEKPEGGIPEEFIDLVAKKIFDKYGDEIAETINRKVSQQLEPIVREINQIESDIRHLKATSDEKIRDFLKTMAEVTIESVAEKAAKKAIEDVNVDAKLDALNNSIKAVREMQMEMAEKLEKLSGVLNNAEDTLSKFTRSLENVSELSESIRKEVDKSLEEFNRQVEVAINKAVESIRENVVIDKSLLESVVSQTLSRLVSSKFTEIEAKVVGLSNRVDALSKSVEGLRVLQDALEDAINKIEELREAVNAIQIGIAQRAIPSVEPEPESGQEDVEQKAKEVKEAQDEDEWTLGGAAVE